ncbi:MAG: S8 family serine peptidase [Flavobacteriales bacterium]
MRTIPFLVLLLTFPIAPTLRAQTAPDTHWVQFTDKSNTPFSLSAPEQFLSTRALERRQAQNIGLDESDLPVDPAYIATVLAQGDVQLINRSKWFNAITIRTSDPATLLAIEGLPFVQSVRSAHSLTGERPDMEKFGTVGQMSGERGGGSGAYGPSFLQISMMNGHLLHAINAQGQGMLIGVLDSGFDKADSLPAFQQLRDRSGIILTRDMVNHDGDVYDDHWHGRSVLSCMVGVLDSQLLGTAPAADYVLLRTEDAGTEYVVEEDNWVAGAELCDSLGCDVLNTSLGYTVFDDSLQNHTYGDMDGATTRISIAANMASRKGMIPVCSAGNSGSSEWHYISAPADAIDILTVGAVGDVENSAPFSSRGPSADGRVKPDVCAMGWGAIALGFDGDSIAASNGTSFSSPILAGLVACLWQLHPGRTAQEIMAAVRQSASFYAEPNDSLGYGVPDFMQAHEYLVATTGMADRSTPDPSVFPLPFTDRLEVLAPDLVGPCTVSLFDPAGREVWTHRSISVVNGRFIVADGDLAVLPAGLYVLRVRSGDRSFARSVAKSR